MAIFYKHGIYGEKVDFSDSLFLKSQGTIPVYIGTAPVNKLNINADESFDYSPYINQPILIKSLSEARNRIGYSNDWNKFSLGEVIKAHFDNGDKNISPIIVINMANPKTKKTSQQEIQVDFITNEGKKIGYIDDDTAIAETVSISLLTKGEDYSVCYDDNKIKITVTNKTESVQKLTTVTYNCIDTSEKAITTDMFEQALKAIDLCELATGIIPNILSAPSYSNKPDYHRLMINKTIEKISQKWQFICVSDIPCDNTETIDKAILWKKNNFYNNVSDKLCFPMIKYRGDIYHLSTMATVCMQETDIKNDGIPYVSPSNKEIYADAMVLKNGKEVFVTEPIANKANEQGITTVNIIRGKHRLWGNSMSNYDFTREDDISPDERQDTSVRMMIYLLNKLQYDYIDKCDNPISKKDVDGIICDIQQWINSLVNKGCLLYGAVDFNQDENDVQSLISGDFIFNIKTTTTPNAKSFTFKLQYTTDGLAILTAKEV